MIFTSRTVPYIKERLSINLKVPELSWYYLNTVRLLKLRCQEIEPWTLRIAHLTSCFRRFVRICISTVRCGSVTFYAFLHLIATHTGGVPTVWWDIGLFLGFWLSEAPLYDAPVQPVGLVICLTIGYQFKYGCDDRHHQIQTLHSATRQKLASPVLVRADDKLAVASGAGGTDQ